MMKTLAAFLMCIGVATALPGESLPDAITFTNSCGIVVSNAHVIGHSASEVYYEVPGGGARVKLADLPASIQRDFNYQPDSYVFDANFLPIEVNDGSIQRDFTNALALIRIPPGVYERADLQKQLDKIPRVRSAAMAKLDMRFASAVDELEVREIPKKPVDAGLRQYFICERLDALRKVTDDLDDAAAEKKISLVQDMTDQLKQSVKESQASIDRLRK